MTVMVAEAAEGAGEGAAVGSGAAKRGRRPRRHRVYYNEDAGGFEPGPDEGDSGGSKRPTGDRRIDVPYGPYHGVILAEFLITLLVITLVPLATGGSANSQAKGSPSPYDVNDLKQLAATGGVFFILALIPGQQGSRLAAWLGGLITIAVLMSKIGTGGLGAVAAAVAPGPPPVPPQPQPHTPGGVID
jgi:hypothetical protein